MGMIDTILFDQPIPCPKCGAEITFDQTKAFECTLDEYRIGDCVAHAEEIRVVRDELFCGQCKKVTEKHTYLVVYRGILAGIEEDLENTERRLCAPSALRLSSSGITICTPSSSRHWATHTAPITTRNWTGASPKHVKNTSAPLVNAISRRPRDLPG